jgi:hypothetical protein
LPRATDPGGSETILVLEDDPQVCAAARRIQKMRAALA